MRVDTNSKVFASEAFLKDASRFYIIKMNFSNPELLLYSDEESYVICRGMPGFPTWVWTADDICEGRMAEIAQVLAKEYLTPQRNQVTSKPRFYQYLRETGYPYLDTKDYFEMGTLECHALKDIRKCDGHMEPARPEDLDTLAHYFYLDAQEMEGVDSVTMERATEKTSAKIASGTYFVWRNEAGKIVSMADYGIIGTQAKLGTVYTTKEARCKGYATNLIHTMTGDLLDRGLAPLLYTDYNYPASNTAYKNAGYEDTGVLINYGCYKPMPGNKDTD